MNYTFKIFVFRWGPVIAWAMLIFILSSQASLPGPKVIWWDFVLKKSAHMLVFGLFYFLLYRAINWEKKLKTYFIPMFFTILYAVFDEIHQSFIPGRTSLISDVGYDTLGATLAFLKLKNLI